MNVLSKQLELPMVFFRIGWMDHYQGITRHDSISGGGLFVKEHLFGNEIYNFQPFQKKMFGFVQPPAQNSRWTEAKINLTRLGASDNAQMISGVLVVWVSTSPLGGAFIVGWYKNATIYREWQPSPTGSNRNYENVDCGYYISANVEDAVLLPSDARVFIVPQHGTGNFGQSNIWYADNLKLNQNFRAETLNFFNHYENRRSNKQGEKSTPRQPDVLLRNRVEKVAIEKVTQHYIEMGYSVTSVERDNLGWDLNAVAGKRELKLEVKGLSGPQISVGLTPNEYNAMQQHRDTYRVCVVTSSLSTPEINIFSYSQDSGQWEDLDRQVLLIEEIIAARCSI